MIPEVHFTEFDGFDDRDLGVIFTKDNGSILNFSVEVVADPCPSVEWIFNGTRLEVSDTIVFNNPCVEDSQARSHNWTFTLNITVVRATSGNYSAKFTNIAGTTILPKSVYFTIPGKYLLASLPLDLN